MVGFGATGVPGDDDVVNVEFAELIAQVYGPVPDALISYLMPSIKNVVPNDETEVVLMSLNTKYEFSGTVYIVVVAPEYGLIVTLTFELNFIVVLFEYVAMF